MRSISWTPGVHQSEKLVKEGKVTAVLDKDSPQGTSVPIEIIRININLTANSSECL